MATFTDAAGDAWDVSVSYYDVTQIKKTLGFYLPSIFDGKLETMARIYDDIELMVSVVAALCDEQMTARGITPEGFAKRLGGDVLLDASNAVVEATIDFFPDQQRREALRQAWERMLKMDKILRSSMATKAMGMADEVLATMTSSPLSSESSGSASASSESSPGV